MDPLCYSGPAAHENVTADSQRLREEVPLTTFDLLDGLDPAVVALAVQFINSPAKREVLAFFHRLSHTAMEVDDLAYHVSRDEAEVAAALEDLVAMDLIERERIADRSFYRLNRRDPTICRHLETLFGWLVKWQIQLQRLDHLVGVNAREAAFRNSATLPSSDFLVA